ncbi:MAG: cupredoxin domain-containing protein [Actinomycetota bacterium]
MLTLRPSIRTAALVAAVLLAACVMAACGSSKPSSTGHSPSASQGPVGATVVLQNLQFNPAAVTVTAGSAVEWQFNDGTIPHTVTAYNGTFDSGVHSSGTFEHTFTTPGIVSYHCTIHANMTATVTVVSK